MEPHWTRLACVAAAAAVGGDVQLHSVVAAAAAAAAVDGDAQLHSHIVLGRNGLAQLMIDWVLIGVVVAAASGQEEQIPFAELGFAELGDLEEKPVDVSDATATCDC